MKQLTLTLWLGLSTLLLWAQPYGNEWIDYDNNYRYYEFPVYRDGLHRIPYAAFDQANISITDDDLEHIRLFAFGEEIPIYIETGFDGEFFSSQDYIEFLGEGNDGRKEDQLFEDSSWHANPDYSMFNDTIRYYLAIPQNDNPPGDSDPLRFTETDQSQLADYIPKPYVWYNSKLVFSEAYHIQAQLFPGVESSINGMKLGTYDLGEGWASSAIGLNGSRTVNVPTPNVYSENPELNATLKTTLIGVSDMAGDNQNDHHIQISHSGTLLVNEQYNGYRVKQYELIRPLATLGEENTPIQFQVVDALGVIRDDQAFSNIEISYPRIPDLENLNTQVGFRFIHEFNDQNTLTRYNFQNVPGIDPRIYTFGANPQRIELNQIGEAFPFLIENSNDGDDFECLLSSDQSLNIVESLKAVNNSGYFTDFLEVQEDSAMVIITHKIFMTGPNPVTSQYEEYREFGTNTLNRNMNVVVVDVDELYDQFGYGVPKSGLAMRNFARFMLQEWDSRPQFLLLLGNSVRTVRRTRIQDGTNLQGYRSSPSLYDENLVPSAGYPMSDNLITAGLFGSELVPQIPTGRISALSPSQAQWYLNKLIEFENQPPDLWMKNFMHFGGGQNDFEQTQFANFLADYEAIAVDSSYGANVHTFLKTSDEIIQINVNDEISQLIDEEGTSMMTFFAHAGANAGFDQSIDDPNNFEWNGKYPFLLGNGCYTADYHNADNNSISEGYVLLQDKGTIGFLATSDVGYRIESDIFSENFYEQLSVKNYGGAVGEHVKNTIAEMESTLTESNYVRYKYHTFSFSLQGDPSVILNSWPLPDFKVAHTDIFFTPENITAELDSFTVNIVVSNIGRATNMSFDISIEHNKPNDSGNPVYVSTLNGLYYQDTVSFRIGIDLQNDLGLHTFSVIIDQSSSVDELDESNNSAEAQLFLASSGIVPIIPKRFAVVPQGDVVLKASTGNPLAEPKEYLIQIDTTDTFDSPAFQSTSIVQSGGVVEWQPKLNYPDSIVYFWRCAEAAVDNIWQNSSFQFIPDKSGWGQDHIFQLENNSLSATSVNRNSRQLDFFQGNVTIGNNVNTSPGNINVTVNTEIIEYDLCIGFRALYVAILDPTTFQAWGTSWNGQNPENDFGNANSNGQCRDRVEYYFIFSSSSRAQLEAFSDLFISDIIPDGHYVVIYTVGGVNYNDWDNTSGNIYDVFEELGAVQIGSEFADNFGHFSLIAKKGFPETAQEIYGDAGSGPIQNVYTAQANLGEGVVKTPKIGPALSWENGSWKLTTIDELEGDESIVKLIGITPEGVEVPISGGDFSLNFPGGEDEIDLSALVNAQEYPELRLQADLKDLSNTTPLQIDRWHILYEDVPEAAVDPNTHFEFNAETLQQGEPGSISVAIRNISDVDMDSLLVHYWIEDKNRNRIDIPYPRQAPLDAGATLIDTVDFDTRYLSGRNVLWVEVNPKDENGVTDQPEQNHFNNLLQIPFNITLDTENPVLDVTFDGIHIINGEIVSPEPEIVIALKDENPFLIMDEPADTALFKLFLTRPGSNENERLHFTPSAGEEEYMRFIPATDEKNRAKILLNPKLEENGRYLLRIKAEDKSGNNSSIRRQTTEGEQYNYDIEFEVIRESTITEVLNYPNPFSTSTQFVFTLTGSQVPDEFKIQIMTISGRVVREIMLDEFGPIRVGRNISNYRWDGRDEFGDRLANGVYLYRVIARINGEDITNRDGGAGHYFKESFGKMVLFR